MATTASGGRRRTQARGGVSRSATKAAQGTKKKSRTPAPPPEPAGEAAAGAETTAIPLSAPEPVFAARVPPPVAPPPRPAARRAIFLDVENTSRPQHLAHVIDHLAVDRRDCTTELVAVANWKVVSHDSARLLAQRGAQLVHSAPSTGVRDWSDLRIAVAAGIWLAGARPGDTIEIVSDDRAFDAVGDVAASLGIGFRRLSYRQLVKEEVTEIASPEPRHEPERESRGHRRRRRGGRGRSGAHGPPRKSVHERKPAAVAASQPRGHAAHGAPHAAEPHTAPHDEIVALVRELVDAAPGRSVSLDALANALKSRGFRRPPGSLRLVTRLRRIREVLVSPSGAITLAEDAVHASEPERHTPEDRPREPLEEGAVASSVAPAGAELRADEPSAGRPPLPEGGRRRRRRRRRGGHRLPALTTP